MRTKIFAVAAVAALLTLGGAATASADYPDEVVCTADPASIVVGATSVASCTGVNPGSVQVTATGPGVVDGTLSSIVFAGTTGSTTIEKTADAEGNVSATFTGPAVGSFVITFQGIEQAPVSVTVEVTAASTPPDGGLPPTGATLPAGAIWLGIGAIGLGGIAIAAIAARRRALGDR